MTIHHSQRKKAEKAGIILTQEGDLVTAFWPQRALKLTGASASDAMAQMQAATAILNSHDGVKLIPDVNAPRLVNVYDDGGCILRGSPMTPVAAHKMLVLDLNDQWDETEPDDEILVITPDPDAPKRINGVAVDGAVAYAEGTPAGDCPYSSEDSVDNPDGSPEEYDNFLRWNEEWDAAADAHEEVKVGGSVVSEKYRAKYAEAGHPTHCGDWLAETLNDICLNKANTNLELFEEICQLNGVDTSKYKRSGIGWEGRIRMTGRNLMARKVYIAGGVLVLPLTIHGGAVKAPAEWMARQRYKMPKTVQAKPIPDTVIVIRTKEAAA